MCVRSSCWHWPRWIFDVEIWVITSDLGYWFDTIQPCLTRLKSNTENFNSFSFSQSGSSKYLVTFLFATLSRHIWYFCISGLNCYHKLGLQGQEVKYWQKSEKETSGEKRTKTLKKDKNWKKKKKTPKWRESSLVSGVESMSRKHGNVFWTFRRIIIHILWRKKLKSEKRLENAVICKQHTLEINNSILQLNKITGWKFLVSKNSE